MDLMQAQQLRYTDDETEACPDWCVEHYATDAGAWNHSSAPRSVTGESATSGHPNPVSTWLERRDWPDGSTTTVGIVEKVTEDTELTSSQLRDFADHLLAVADDVERMATVSVDAESLNLGKSQVTVRQPVASAGDRTVEVVLGQSSEQLYLSPVGARRLGTALLAASRRPNRPTRP